MFIHSSLQTTYETVGFNHYTGLGATGDFKITDDLWTHLHIYLEGREEGVFSDNFRMLVWELP